MSDVLIFEPRNSDPSGLLRSSRERAGLDHEQFASELGRLVGRAQLSPGAIRAWERGITRPPPEILRAAQKLASGATVDQAPTSTSPLIGTIKVTRPATTPDNGAEQVVQAFRDADRQVGGGYVYGSVLRYLEHNIAPNLFSGTADMFSAAASLTEMAGWMAHDAGADTDARHHFDRALQFASATDDNQLAAHIHASLSHLSHQAGNPRDGLALAVAGRNILQRSGPHPALAARLHAMEARGFAALHRSADCGRALMAAERDLDHQPSQHVLSPWVSPFDHASLASEASQCMHQLNQLAAARHQSEQIIKLRHSSHARSRAFGQLRLAAILVSQREIDQACAVSETALAETDRLSSSRVTQLLASLHEQLKPHASHPRVRDLTQTLATALSTRTSDHLFITAASNFEV